MLSFCNYTYFLIHLLDLFIYFPSYIGSHVVRLVGCWALNQRVVCSITDDANNFLGQDVNLDCASLHPQVMGT